MDTNEILLKCLDIEWQDLFQVRTQTWRPLETEAVLAVALVGIDWRLGNIYATSAVAILLIVAALSGIIITLRHRNDVEIGKFTHIIDIEKRLGLCKPGGVYEKVKAPAPMKWTQAFSFKYRSTMHFILRMHLILMAFGFIYFVFRIVVK